MKTILSILVATLISLPIHAERVTYLEEGAKTPYAGMLLDRNAVDKVNIVYRENDFMKKDIEHQNDMLLNVHKQNVEYEKQINILKKQEDNENLITKVLYFVGGALVGGLVVKTVGK